MKLDTKSKKKIKKKNNALKRAFFLTKKPEIEKTEKSKKLNFSVPFMCTLKMFYETNL